MGFCKHFCRNPFWHDYCFSFTIFAIFTGSKGLWWRLNIWNKWSTSDCGMAYQYGNGWCDFQEKKEEIWLSPMTKAPTPTEMSTPLPSAHLQVNSRFSPTQNCPDVRDFTSPSTVVIGMVTVARLPPICAHAYLAPSHVATVADGRMHRKDVPHTVWFATISEEVLFVLQHDWGLFLWLIY